VRYEAASVLGQLYEKQVCGHLPFVDLHIADCQSLWNKMKIDIEMSEI